jgi:dTDP-4-amino-4,6-dideoxygalactose transaminase
MIPYGKQSISEEDIEAVTNAMRGDFLTTGPLVELFENEISKVVGAPAISVSSGTAALHCAYAAIGIEPGDEVITPPMTFIATQATAAIMGAKIVFADIQEDTGNIDPKAVEAAITTRTKAIVAVDYAGHPADMDELRIIADKYGVFLIEDAAHSIGSTYKGRPVGSLADLTTFSFFPTKNITTGEGGAISSPNPELLSKAKSFSRQGLVRDPAKFLVKGQGQWHQEVHKFGLNYRLSDILCALGISQIQRISKFKFNRYEIFNKYQDELSNVDQIKLPTVKPYVDPMWHLFPIFVEPKKRRIFFEELKYDDIGVQVNYFPAHLHPVFEYMNLKGAFPISENFYNREISLPMNANLNQQEFEKILNSIIRITRL